MSYAIRLAAEDLVARASGALFWPAQELLCVSDLHLGKAERMARRAGALLPPYDSRDTLARLEAEIAVLRPRTVICLGDSFDDGASLAGLEEDARLWLARLMAGRAWVWITGNHDPGPLEIAGTHRAEVQIAGLRFRHIAEAGGAAKAGGAGEISGHYHPKVRLAGKAWRCFLADADRMILPAFGTYTGGLWADDPAFDGLFGPAALAISCGGTVARAMPKPRASTRSR
ncbi:MAG: ligase-associated DNA damage response endonuclease PdeM [Rhodobacteraceae bacterium]|nr:ligase-associated DNA damage response endonuclease PdeM [Paracoccaceae bacterium]